MSWGQGPRPSKFPRPRRPQGSRRRQPRQQQRRSKRSVWPGSRLAPRSWFYSAKIKVQRLKHEASQLAAAQEETKKAQAAGGGLEEAGSVAKLLAEGGQVLNLLESIEKYRLELEGEEFSKVSAKVTRGSPY